MDWKLFVSNLHFLENFYKYGIKILLIVILMYITYRILNVFFKRISKVNIDDIEQQKRVKTIYYLIDSSSKIIICLIGVMFILEILNVNIAPILATAGVLGIAIGFGSQRLIEDVFSGLNIILTNQIRVGDTVSVNNLTGVVEKVTLNNIILRDYNGVVHFIRNGTINIISNMTKDFSYYVTTIGISYNQDIEKVFETIKRVGKEMQEDNNIKNYILSEIEIPGVDGFEDSAVSIMVRIKTAPSMQWLVGRDFNRRIKEAFDKNKIEFPFPQRTIHIENGN